MHVEGGIKRPNCVVWYHFGKEPSMSKTVIWIIRILVFLLIIAGVLYCLIRTPAFLNRFRKRPVAVVRHCCSPTNNLAVVRCCWSATLFPLRTLLQFNNIHRLLRWIDMIPHRIGILVREGSAKVQDDRRVVHP